MTTSASLYPWRRVQHGRTIFEMSRHREPIQPLPCTRMMANRVKMAACSAEVGRCRAINSVQPRKDCLWRSQQTHDVEVLRPQLGILARGARRIGERGQPTVGAPCDAVGPVRLQPQRPHLPGGWV